MNAEKSKSIPQRADIEDKYKWQLSDLYKTEDAWEADYKKAQGLIARADEFRGKLAGSAQLLYDCLVCQTDLGLICENLHFYAKRSQDLDHRVSKYQAMTDRAAMLASQAGAAYSFVEPELLNIEDDKLLEMAGQFPDTNIYDF